MATAPFNSDLPSSYKIPGVYTQINLSGSGGSADDPNRRALIIGYRLASAAFGPDTPKLETQQSDVNADFGQGSDVARAYAAFQSQNGPGVADVWCLGIAEPSGGTAATYTITFAGTATAAGLLDNWIAGYRSSIGIASGDAAAAVCTNLYTELLKQKDLPCTFTDSGTGTLTVTYRVKGAIGNDLPIMFNQQGGTGITVSPGRITYATAAVGAGSATVTVGATTITAALAGGETAAQVATKVAAAINGGSYPVTCSDDLSGNLTLLYANNRPVRRISAAIVTTTGTTATVSLHGTTGAGNPTLTTALTNLDALTFGFSSIVSCFNDTTTLGTLSTDLEVQTNGVNQKPGELFFGGAAALATAGAVPTGTSPALTASPRYSLQWCRETPQQAYEIAARVGAEYLFSDYFARNLDGAVLRTRGGVPLLNPAVQDRPPTADMNSAIRTYYMTPITVNSQNQLTILRGTTTSNSSNQDLAELSTMRQLDTARTSFNARMISLFSSKSYRTSTPKTPNTITPQSVADAAYVWARELDDQDLFDNAAAWKSAFVCSVDPNVNTRLDVFIPLALIRSLHQLGSVLSPK